MIHLMATNPPEVFVASCHVIRAYNAYKSVMPVPTSMEYHGLLEAPEVFFSRLSATVKNTMTQTRIVTS